MIDLTNIDDVKRVIANVRGALDTPDGEEVMKFLEQSCGWYDSIFSPDDRDYTLISAGRREPVALLKTLLEQSPEQIVAMAQEKESGQL